MQVVNERRHNHMQKSPLVLNCFLLEGPSNPGIYVSCDLLSKFSQYWTPFKSESTRLWAWLYVERWQLCSFKIFRTHIGNFRTGLRLRNLFNVRRSNIHLNLQLNPYRVSSFGEYIAEDIRFAEMNYGGTKSSNKGYWASGDLLIPLTPPSR